MPGEEAPERDGAPSRRCIASMRSVASLSDTPGARLKETVTDGNKLVWLIGSGRRVRVTLARPVRSGIRGRSPFGAVPSRCTSSPAGVCQYCGADLEDDVVLVGLRVDDRHLRLPEAS